MNNVLCRHVYNLVARYAHDLLGGEILKALILSGGSGTRLRPLTYTNAKQLLPLAKKPILIHIIEKIVGIGIKEIGIIVGDTRDEVERVVGNGEQWNIQVTYIHQTPPLGLAHAVNMAKDFIGEDDFLMVLGDNVFSMELNKFIDNFYESRIGNTSDMPMNDSKAVNSSLLLYKVENPSQYGVAVVENNYIVKLVEKPKDFISDLIITGIYIFDKSIFTAIENTKPSQRGELEITDAIQKQIEMGGKVTYEIIEGWWKDTGNLEDMLEANRLMLGEIKRGCEYQYADQANSKLEGTILMDKHVVIKNSTITGPVAIADGSTILDSRIGPNTSIGKEVTVVGCEIDNSIILNNTQLNNVNKRISGSLIGKDVKIKSTEEGMPCISLLVGDNCEINL